MYMQLVGVAIRGSLPHWRNPASVYEAREHVRWLADGRHGLNGVGVKARELRHDLAHGGEGLARARDDKAQRKLADLAGVKAARAEPELGRHEVAVL